MKCPFLKLFLNETDVESHDNPSFSGPIFFFSKNKYNFYKPFPLSLSKIFKKLLGWVRSYGGTFFFFGPRLPNCPELDIFWKNQSCNFGAPLHLFACAKLKKVFTADPEL